MSRPELQKNILTTLAYYDVMDYPMTSFEVWKYLTTINQQPLVSDTQKHSLLEIINELEDEKLKRFIEEFRGFYFLKGRQELVGQRLEKNKIAERKLRRLLRTAKWLRFVPYVRMMAVTGSLAMKNTEGASDLDLLVVLKSGKIWTGRALVTLVTHLLGQRRHGKKIADRICLNYFITKDSLEINLKDVFSASEYSFIFPIFGFKVFRKFQKNNEWIKKYKPNYQLEGVANLKMLKDNFLIRGVRRAGELLFGPTPIESRLKKWQAARIVKDPRTHQAGSLILATDEMLVFLPEPQSPQVFGKFQKKLQEMAIKSSN